MCVRECQLCGYNTKKCVCFDDWDYPETEPVMQRQSTPVKVDPSTVENNVQETVVFEDVTSGVVETMAPGDTALALEDKVASADLADFLARPVRIATITWLESAAAGTLLSSLNPWQLFFNETRIKFKLNNFAFLRAKLKVKIMINASPFYFGQAAAVYQPLPNLTPSTIYNDGSNRFLIPLSQRPKVWISPQDNMAGELELPFFWPKNWLNVSVSQEFADMGKLDFYSYTDLASANGVVGTGATISVYAWAEDVVLSGSTLSLAMQSQPRDEYADGGPVSKPAMALANAAGTLTPIFGKFATATQMALRTTASIAKLFGYTNVPVIDPPRPLRMEQFANFASAEIGYPVKKLTIDPKAELALDTSVVGLDGKDEMSFQHICTKESYLYQTSWTTAQVADTILAYNVVHPQQFNKGPSGTVPSYDVIYYTPMAHLSTCYTAWRGDIIFRFKFVASPYHKGRVKITYDPVGDNTNNPISVPDGTSGAYSIIVDLSESAEAEMRIPFQQALPWLKNADIANLAIPFSTSTTPTFVKDLTQFNGSWTMRVLTTLTAPVLSSTVPVMVFVRAADNLEFNNPVSIRQNLYPFVPQSQPVDLGSAPKAMHEKRGLVNYGETHRSIRPIIRRTQYVGPATWIPTTPGLGDCSITHFKIPPYPGFDTGGWYQVNKNIIPGIAQFNWTAFSPMQWMALAYVAYRGSTMWHYMPHVGSASVMATNMRITRLPQNTSDTGVLYTVNSLSATSASRNALSSLSASNGGGGIIVNPRIQAGEAIGIPNNVNYLFQSTNPASATRATTSANPDGHAADCVEVDIDCTTSGLSAASTSSSQFAQLYCGAGTDFNLLWYLNAPVIFYSTTIPLPV